MGNSDRREFLNKLYFAGLAYLGIRLGACSKPGEGTDEPGTDPSKPDPKKPTVDPRSPSTEETALYDYCSKLVKEEKYDSIEAYHADVSNFIDKYFFEHDIGNFLHFEGRLAKLGKSVNYLQVDPSPNALKVTKNTTCKVRESSHSLNIDDDGIGATFVHNITCDEK